MSQTSLLSKVDGAKNEKDTNNEEEDKEKTRLNKDYQLARAIDLIKGINVYQQTLIEK